jgi:hypothetical protein
MERTEVVALASKLALLVDLALKVAAKLRDKGGLVDSELSAVAGALDSLTIVRPYSDEFLLRIHPSAEIDLERLKALEARGFLAVGAQSA